MDMNTVVVAVVLFAAIFLAVRVSAASRSVNSWPFYAKKLLSPPEQVLYFRLQEAFPDHLVFPQVQLSRILGVKKGNRFNEWNNRINRMSADFVICRKDSSVVAVIELDDSTHDRAARKEADAKKDKALLSAGVCVLRYSVKEIPCPEEVQCAVSEKTKPFLSSDSKAIKGEGDAMCAEKKKEMQ